MREELPITKHLTDAPNSNKFHLKGILNLFTSKFRVCSVFSVLSYGWSHKTLSHRLPHLIGTGWQVTGEVGYEMLKILEVDFDCGPFIRAYPLGIYLCAHGGTLTAGRLAALLLHYIDCGVYMQVDNLALP